MLNVGNLGHYVIIYFIVTRHPFIIDKITTYHNSRGTTFPTKLHVIMKIYLHNFDPLTPHFYIVKLEFTAVYIIFIISAQKHKLWVLVRTTSSRWF